MQKTILIFRIGSLGDTVVALPSFHHIRQHEKNARIILLTNAPVDGGIKAASSFQVLFGSGLVDDYLDYRAPNSLGDVHRLLKRIRTLRASRAYYLMPRRSVPQRLRDGLFLALAGIHDVRGLDLLREHNRPRLLPDGSRYESEAMRLRRSIGGIKADQIIRFSASDYSLRLSDAEITAASQVLQGFDPDHGFLTISIGTKLASKDWGDANWFALLKILNQQLPAQLKGMALVFLGSADEQLRSARLAAQWNGPTFNLCGKLTPRVSGSVIAQGLAFVGHDSGPMHLASAVGVPTVAIFSARDRPGVWFPFNNETNVFYNKVDCYNCGLEVCIEQKMRCILSIEPVAVADKLLSVLKAKAPSVDAKCEALEKNLQAETESNAGLVSIV